MLSVTPPFGSGLDVWIQVENEAPRTFTRESQVKLTRADPGNVSMGGRFLLSDR
jgi:hypothetical protein